MKSPSSSFLIYNAAAGSGKTFTLVKSYLKRILISNYPDSYKHLLAITFTNKAVSEMKTRIIDQLNDFANHESSLHPGSMMRELSQELSMTTEQIQARSKLILNHILHHYASFNVETIDSFNHRLIRTFSRELKIASNFEVSLDTDLLLQKAVDNLIAKSGTDDELTRLLIDFTLEKTEDDYSWDISRDIKNVSENLFKERQYQEIESLMEIPVSEFRSLSAALRKKREELTKAITQTAEEALKTIDEASIPWDAFSSKTLPNHFNRLIKGERKLYETKFAQNMSEGSLVLYPKRVAPAIQERIEQISEFLRQAFLEARSMAYRESLLSKILSNLIPLSVLNLVQQEVKLIQEEENIMPIADFNQLIHAEIKKQPAPYIYERLGDRFRHYFIDEFQDTSVLQWNNLQPLIDNALSQEFSDGNPGSLLLVGDPKQSIYRWRGGEPEQFIGLYNCNNPFGSQDKEVLNLETNWRSRASIIDFNNKFFTHVSDFFSDRDHKHIYQIGNRQKANPLHGGYIELSFISPDQNRSSVDDHYFTQTSETIRQLLDKGFEFGDICILTRSNKDGISLGNLLTEVKIPIVSSETLLLQHSEVVLFLVNCLIMKESQIIDELAVEALQFLHEHTSNSLPLHEFLQQYVSDGTVSFENALTDLGKDFSYINVHSKSMLETAEYLIHNFELSKDDGIYIEGFMNLLHNFEQERVYSELSFNDYWEIKKEKAAVNVGESLNAVKILTIHKAKGLEFPVVIFPYADMSITDVHRLSTWYDIGDISEKINKAMIPVSKDLQHYSEQGRSIYEQLSTINEFDQINLLYVVMTRAIDALYIFAKRPSGKNIDNPKNFGELFRSFLEKQGEWNDELDTYRFGNLILPEKDSVEEKSEHIPLDYIVSLPENQQLKMATAEAKIWRSKKDSAIYKGSLLHSLMEHIRHYDDLDSAIRQFEQQPGLEADTISETINIAGQILNDPNLKPLFTDFNKVENERDLLTADSRILRPDRINFNKDGSLTVIDYKTGKKEEEHGRQLREYSEALESMGYQIKERLIIYGNSEGVFVNMI